MDELRKGDIAPQTRAKYLKAWEGLLEKANFWGVHPNEAFHPYVAHMFKKEMAPSYIANQCAGIKYMHREIYGSMPDDPETLSRVLKGIYRLGKRPQEVTTISLDQFNRATKIIPILASNLYDSYLYNAALFMMYFGLCRSSEITGSPHAILLKDVEVTDLGILIGFRSHKTLQRTSQKQLVKIPLRGTDVPSSFLTSYLRVRPIPRLSCEPLLVSWNGEPLKRDQLRRFIAKVHRIVLGESKAHLHGYRRGGATHLFRQGCAHDDIKALGRWKGDGHLRYIRR